MAAPMASDGGLRRLFEKPVPENPTLLEALSAWNHRSAHPNKPIDAASFTEIFGEIHFQENQGVLPQPPAPEPAPRPPPRAASWLDAAAAEAEKNKDGSSLDALLRPKPASAGGASAVKRSASFCTKKSSASLLLCTEGLGSESTVDADDMRKDGDAEAEAAAAAAARVEDMAETTEDAEKGGAGAEEVEAEVEKRRRPPSFPPPIRSIGRGGRPSVCFRSFRNDDRFVLLEVIPGKELLLATREGGRLRLQFARAPSLLRPRRGAWSSTTTRS